MGKGDSGGNAVGPWAKDRRLAQVRKLAKDLKRGLLKDIVCQGGANKPGDVASQRRVNVAEELLQCGPIAGPGEKDEHGLIGRLEFLRLHAQ
jgi:hypothetical protein